MFELSKCDSDVIAVVTLAHPPANALGFAQIEQLSALLDELAGDGLTRAIIFRSEARFFSAGADITLMAESLKFADGADRMAMLCRQMQAAFAKLEAIEMPTFAAISGVCVGGGLELALACDFRIAETNALLGLPEVKIGLLPGAGGTQRLTAIAGRGTATRLIMTGDLIDGEHAARLGIVQEAVTPGEAFERALDFARAVVTGPRKTLAAIKRCLALAPSPEGYEAEVAETRTLHLEAETRERIAAFLDKTAKKKKRVAV